MSGPTKGWETGQTDMFGNRYFQGNDGKYYKTDGNSYWETAETKKQREQEENRNREPDKPSNTPLHTDAAGYTSSDTSREMLEGAATAGKGILAAIAGVGIISFFLAWRKNPNDPKSAAKYALRNSGYSSGVALCLLTMLGIIVGWIIYHIGNETYTTIGLVCFIISEIICLIACIGFVRKIAGKSFFIKFHKPELLAKNTKPTPFWHYIIIEIGSIAVMSSFIYKIIEKSILDNNQDLIMMKSWLPDQYMKTVMIILGESIGIAAILGIVICIGYKVVKRYI